MIARIPPDPDRPGLDSEDLFRLGQLLSRRLHLPCPRCRADLPLTVEGGGLRIGSSPDLSEIDPSKPGKPRLVLWCSHCMRSIGYVQGDSWSARTGDDLPERSRWNHLELEEGSPSPSVPEFDLD